MPKYGYKAVNSAGHAFSGVLEGATDRQVAEQLKQQGLWVTKLVNHDKSILHRDLSLSIGGGPKVKLEPFTVFCRQLAVMYRAGIRLVDAVGMLSEHAPSKPFRSVLADIAEQLSDGKQFSAAAASHPSVFSPIFINMTKAGEMSGTLDEMLERLAVYYEKENKTKKKVQSALVYPAIMSVVTVAVVIFMMIFVVPRYVQTFRDMGIELPLSTRIVIAASDFVSGYWYIVLASLFLPKLITAMIRRTDGGGTRLDYIKLKVPVFGKLWHKQALARFSRTFGSLFAAGVPIMESLTLVSQVVANEAIGSVINRVKDGVMKGDTLSEPLRRSKLFPPMLVQMMTVGEQTGALDGMLNKIADFYEDDVDAMADRLKSLLEPIMILIIAGIVGVIVLAVMTPTFKLMQEM
ncbi:type II secretion system F family protein [Paenibacillus kobensis]|uniref:type II secretion system F family protein n=1 Tax=Paenibacillus kobensis TaxID=59841 RepID=UPI000FDBBE11|nr:type II secretion system F family protein [Paenibacillus kobensis]